MYVYACVSVSYDPIGCYYRYDLLVVFRYLGYIYC